MIAALTILDLCINLARSTTLQVCVAGDGVTCTNGEMGEVVYGVVSSPLDCTTSNSQYHNATHRFFNGFWCYIRQSVYLSTL